MRDTLPDIGHGFSWMVASLCTAQLVFVSGTTLAADDQGGFVQRTINQFEQSDFEFQRSISNAPFPPLGFLSGTSYSNVEVDAPDGGQLEYDVDRISQMAAVPFILGQKDALIVGQYLSRTEFDLNSQEYDDIGVTSIGLPLGWMRQHSPDWQLAAFVMPLAHESNLDNSSWDWQYLGGAFARYIQNDQLWWAFGVYADVGPGDNVYIPYLGASWAINEHWTLSAVMPWPALIYAPGPSWMVRLGASPSGASWSMDLEREKVGVNLDAWDFGLGAEYRAAGNFWVGAEAGVGGLRGLHLVDSNVEEPDLEFSNNGYLRLTFKYRPALSP